MPSSVTGIFIGFLAGSATAILAAEFVGGNGFLVGWRVMRQHQVVFNDPIAWPAVKEIECQ